MTNRFSVGNACLVRRRGRSADPDLISRVERAAQALFPVYGFDRVSMDVIAAEAGIVKATVYKYFDSKEALFDATLASLLRSLPLPETLIPTGCASTYERLLDMARRVHALMTGDQIEALHRMLSFPMKFASDHKRQVWESTFQRYKDAVCSVIKGAALEGLPVTNDDEASSMFFALIVGVPAVRSYLTGRPICEVANSDHYLSEAVRFFLGARYLP